MAGSVAQRIEVLEKLYSIDTRAAGPEGWMETMAASLRLAEQKATDEEAQGDLRRRHALNNLFKFLSGDEPHGG
jgi:hypothetical protein